MEVPFVVCELPKEYPYEVLTNSQRIRCYH